MASAAIGPTRPDRRVGERTGAATATLALGAFTGVANSAMLSPLLVPIARQFGVSQGTAGQLGSVTAFAAMVVALVGAPHVRRWPARTWLRVQALLVALAALLCALAPGFGWLVVGRALAGIGGALMLATCMAATADLTPDPVRRNRAVGIVVSATTLAIVVGLPAFAQIETAAGWRWAIAALTVPLGLLFVGTRALPAVTNGAAGGSGYRAVLGEPRSLWLLATMALYGLVYYGWLTYYGAYLDAEFGAGAGTLSALFLASGGVELATNNLAPVVVRRVRPELLFAGGTLVWSAALLGTGVLFTTVGSLFAAIAITGCCACVLYVVIYVRAVESAPAIRGTVVSLLSAASGFGGAIGTAAGGVAYGLSGDYATVYRLLGVVLLGTVATFHLAMRERRAQQAAVGEARLATASSGAD